MPVIPFQISERSIPGTSGGVYAPSEDPVGAAITKAGAQFTQSADKVMDVLTAQRLKEERLRQHNEAEKAGNDLKENTQLILEAHATHPDWTADDVQQSFDSVLGNIKNKIKDPLVLQTVDNFAAQHSLELMSHARVLDTARTIDEAKVQTIVSTKNNLLDIIDVPTMEAAIKRTNAELDVKVGLGVYHKTEAQILKDHFAASAAETTIEGMIKTDPATALTILNDKKNSITRYLDPVNKVPELIQKAQVSGKALSVTENLIKLKTEFPDIQKRIDRIESTDFLKTLGPNGAAIQDALMSYSLREWQVQEKNYKEFSDDKIGKVSVAIYNGQTPDPKDLEGLHPPELALIEKIRDYQGRQDRAELSEKRREAAVGRAEVVAARQEARIVKQENSAALSGGILAKILNNDPIDIKQDIYSKIPSVLDINEANRLVAMVGKIQGDPKYKLGADVIDKAFKLGVIDAPTRGKALIDFHKRVEEEGATGKRIIDIADEIVNPKKTSAVKEWIKNIWTTTVVGAKQAPDGKFYVPDSTRPGKYLRVD